MAGSTIKVGVFGANSPDADCPANMEGKNIWYSDKFRFFVITDHNNVNVGEFAFDAFKEFIDLDVILFATPGTQNHMQRLLREWEAEQAMKDPFGSFDALNDLAQSDSSFQNIPDEPQPVRRGSSNREDILGEEAASKQKDPTRHLPVFMVLTLVFTLIICIAINFGQPIIQAVAPLLS